MTMICPYCEVEITMSQVAVSAIFMEEDELEKENDPDGLNDNF